MRFVTRAPRSLFLLVGGAMAVWLATVVSPRARAADRRRREPVAGGPAAGRVRRTTLKVLFLGQDQATHPAAGIYQAIGAPLARKGIQLTPVLSPAALTAERLRYYDALIIYGNHTTLTPDAGAGAGRLRRGRQGPRRAPLGVGDVHRLRALHALIGAQSQRQGTPASSRPRSSSRRTPRCRACSRLRRGTRPSSSRKQNAAGRTVLMERVDGTGPRAVDVGARRRARARVFYTAYGHDQRTWSNPGFQTLIEHAVVWSVDEPARQALQQLKMPAVTYVDGFNVPNYENRDPAPKYQLPFTPTRR